MSRYLLQWEDWLQRLIRWRRSPFIAYSLAVAIVLFATALRLAIDPVAGDRVPFITFFPAVLLATLAVGRWDWRPAWSVGLSVVLAWYLFIPPRYSFLLGKYDDLRLLALFGGAALGTAAIAALFNGISERLLSQHSELGAAKQREADQSRMVIREQQHRIGNLLTVVRAIALRSFRGTSDAAATAFLERLTALGEAYRVDWETPVNHRLTDLLHRLLAPHADRICIKSCDVELPDTILQDLALIVHELHTNAIKYGALSVESGRVIVSCAVNEGPEGPVLHFLWHEKDGPPISRPTRAGFGDTVLRDVARQGGGSASLDFEPSGLRYQCLRPLGRRC